ncbi:hypothetical protein OH540_31285 [Streptomyces sp. BPPL-273]|uniref:hypothetical protein n=1 Tax=Streptomyces sp. BPPL-273 TaxID=2987533 RepID=UPI0024AED4E8|nr:hypothetical protein [Streptomyces sp. BPPL-273]WHM34279.1 hypothetical protein OH540_31285 [Streptomyces sp. BPPL-273]
MSDPADVDGAEQAGSCCAAITELRRRAAQRTEQHPQADDSEGLTASSPGPARDA